MKNRKVIITAIVTIILAIVGGIFGIKYTDEDINKISEGIDTVVDVIETAEIANLTQEDEQTTEVQEANLENDTFKEKSEVNDLVKGLPIIPDEYKPIIKLINKKPILPSKEELAENSRSRSAKLRIIERL